MYVCMELDTHEAELAYLAFLAHHGPTASPAILSTSMSTFDKQVFVSFFLEDRQADDEQVHSRRFDIW